MQKQVWKDVLRIFEASGFDLHGQNGQPGKDSETSSSSGSADESDLDQSWVLKE